MSASNCRIEPDFFNLLIGPRFEALQNLYQPPISLKLKAPPDALHYRAIGRARNAVFTRSFGSRAAYSYCNDEFVRPHNPSVYNSAYTLRDLIRRAGTSIRPESPRPPFQPGLYQPTTPAGQPHGTAAVLPLATPGPTT